MSTAESLCRNAAGDGALGPPSAAQRSHGAGGGGSESTGSAGEVQVLGLKKAS